MADERSTAGDASPALEGTSWLLTERSSLGVELGDVVVSARFAEGRLTGTSGCNSYGTSYSVDGTSLTIGPNITGTRMLCGPVENAVEHAYLQLLPRVVSHEIVNRTLRLVDDEGAGLLEFAAVDLPRAILGSWSVVSCYRGDAVSSVLGGVELTISFGPDAVSGSSGCNTFAGGYQVDGDRITIGPLASTLMLCLDEEVMRQEHDYLAALQLATTYDVRGPRLDLFRPGGTYAVVLRRAKPSP